MADAISTLKVIADSIDAAGRGLAGRLAGDGDIYTILILCAALWICWLIIKGLAEEGGLADAAAGILHAVILTAVLAAMLHHYQDIVVALAELGTGVASKLSGGEDISSVAARGAMSALDTLSASDAYTQQRITQLGMLDAIIALPDRLFSALLFGLLILVVTATGAAAIWVSIVGKLMLWIGGALGPVLIMLAPLPPLRDLTVGWLKFMLTASLIQAVATVMLMLLAGIWTALGGLMSSSALIAPDSGLVLIPIALLALVIALAALMAIFQVPSITAALLAGGAGISSAGPGLMRFLPRPGMGSAPAVRPAAWVPPPPKP